MGFCRELFVGVSTYKLTNCKGLDCQFILGLSRMLFVDSTHLLELFVNKI